MYICYQLKNISHFGKYLYILKVLLPTGRNPHKPKLDNIFKHFQKQRKIMSKKYHQYRIKWHCSKQLWGRLLLKQNHIGRCGIKCETIVQTTTHGLIYN